MSCHRARPCGLSLAATGGVESRCELRNALHPRVGTAATIVHLYKVDAAFAGSPAAAGPLSGRRGEGSSACRAV